MAAQPTVPKQPSRAGTRRAAAQAAAGGPRQSAPAVGGPPAGGAPAARLGRRLLELPKPVTRLDEAVKKTLKTMEDDAQRKEDRKDLEAAIEREGLTIEVARLRDRLLRLPFTDLQRTLLATPGVPEQLLWKAIKEQVEENEQQEEAITKQVKDETVGQLGEAIDKALEDLGRLLAKALKQQQPRPYEEPRYQPAPSTSYRAAENPDPGESPT